MDNVWQFIVWVLGGSAVMSLSHMVCLKFAGYDKDDGAYNFGVAISTIVYVWVAWELWPF